MFNLNQLHYSNQCRRELQRHADMHRLAMLATGSDRQTTLLRRLLVVVGQQMVTSGHYLLARSAVKRAAAQEWEYFGGVAS